MSIGVVSPVLIGRRQEFAVLTALVRRARDGEPAVALVDGKAAGQRR